MICPLIGICKKKVDLDHYREVCSNVTEDKYKECPHYKELTATPKKPSEWSKIFLVPQK